MHLWYAGCYDFSQPLNIPETRDYLSIAQRHLDSVLTQQRLTYLQQARILAALYAGVQDHEYNMQKLNAAYSEFLNVLDRRIKISQQADSIEAWVAQYDKIMNDFRS